MKDDEVDDDDEEMMRALALRETKTKAAGKKKTTARGKTILRKPAAHRAETAKPAAQCAKTARTQKELSAGRTPPAPPLGAPSGPNKAPTFRYRGALIYTSHPRKAFRVVKDASKSKLLSDYSWAKHGGHEAA